MAVSSLVEWKRLSAVSTLPLFHEAGVLFIFDELVDYARDSIEVHERLRLPLEVLGCAELAARWPQIDFAGVELALFEPEFGALIARRAVLELVHGFVERGGEYRLAHAVPGATGNEVALDGETVTADAVVYACGPWLGKVFPELLAQRIFVTRQEIAFIGIPQGDRRFEVGALPGWVDFNGGDVYYGFFQISRGAASSSRAIRTVSRSIPTAACGVMNTGGNACGIVNALLVPFIAGVLGWTAAMVTGTVFALVGAALWLFIRADRPVQ